MTRWLIYLHRSLHAETTEHRGLDEYQSKQSFHDYYVQQTCLQSASLSCCRGLVSDDKPKRDVLNFENVKMDGLVGSDIRDVSEAVAVA